MRSGTWKLTQDNADFVFKDLPIGWYQLRWNALWAGENGRGRLSFGIVPETKRIMKCVGVGGSISAIWLYGGSASPFGIHR